MIRHASILLAALLAACLCSGCSTIVLLFTKTSFPRTPSQACVVEAVREDPAVRDARIVGDDVVIDLKDPPSSGDPESFHELKVRWTRWHYGRTTLRVEAAFVNVAPTGLGAEQWRLLLARLRYRIAAHCVYDGRDERAAP
jgi:hypothetical protein